MLPVVFAPANKRLKTAKIQTRRAYAAAQGKCKTKFVQQQRATKAYRPERGNIRVYSQEHLGQLHFNVEPFNDHKKEVKMRLK